jgi:hypothetical protein
VLARKALQPYPSFANSRLLKADFSAVLCKQQCVKTRTTIRVDRRIPSVPPTLRVLAGVRELDAPKEDIVAAASLQYEIQLSERTTTITAKAQSSQIARKESKDYLWRLGL